MKLQPRTGPWSLPELSWVSPTLSFRLSTLNARVLVFPSLIMTLHSPSHSQRLELGFSQHKDRALPVLFPMECVSKVGSALDISRTTTVKGMQGLAQSQCTHHLSISLTSPR